MAKQSSDGSSEPVNEHQKATSDRYRAGHDRIFGGRRPTGRRGVVVYPHSGGSTRGRSSGFGGDMHSESLAVGLDQLGEANRQLADIGVADRAHYDARGLHIKGGKGSTREVYLKILKARGVHNNDETRGGR